MIFFGAIRAIRATNRCGSVAEGEGGSAKKRKGGEGGEREKGGKRRKGGRKKEGKEGKEGGKGRDKKRGRKKGKEERKRV